MVSALDFAVALKLASSANIVNFCSPGAQISTVLLTARSNAQGPSDGLDLCFQKV